MSELSPKEASIVRIAQTTNLANAFQQLILEHDADVGMAIEAALMIVCGVAKQCPTVEIRCGLLDYLNENIQMIVKMNSAVHEAHSLTQESPSTLQ